jgi:hypothetical protein
MAGAGEDWLAVSRPGTIIFVSGFYPAAARPTMQNRQVPPGKAVVAFASRHRALPEELGFSEEIVPATLDRDSA